MSLTLRACAMAWRDYVHEALLSACAVLSLAAVLAPLLVLYGVKFGVLTTLTERLRNDPRNLEVSPIASGHYSAEFLDSLRTRADVAFVLPRTRSIAATMELAPLLNAGQSAPHGAVQVAPQAPPQAAPLAQRVTVSLEPTASHDPLLTRYLGTVSTSVPDSAYALTLSSEAARKLKAKAGDTLQGRVERLQQGKAQSARVALHVVAVLPIEAQQKDVAFIPLALLEATEDYRDGRAPATDPRLTAALGWSGEPRPAEARVYPGFRLYARSLQDVAVLRDHFASLRVEVYTEAEQIAAVSALDTSLTLIFSLIGGAAALGFVASTASNALAGVRRKEKHLGIIRLTGYPARAIMAFPLFQGLLTAVLGTGLASALYLGAALTIDRLFAHNLQGVERICALLPRHFALALGLVVALTVLATLQPARRAARIEPSEVIREI